MTENKIQIFDSELPSEETCDLLNLLYITELQITEDLLDQVKNGNLRHINKKFEILNAVRCALRLIDPYEDEILH